jgi:hypothetical protein
MWRPPPDVEAIEIEVTRTYESLAQYWEAQTLWRGKRKPSEARRDSTQLPNLPTRQAATARVVKGNAGLPGPIRLQFRFPTILATTPTRIRFPSPVGMLAG